MAAFASFAHEFGQLPAEAGGAERGAVLLHHGRQLGHGQLPEHHQLAARERRQRHTLAPRAYVGKGRWPPHLAPPTETVPPGHSPETKKQHTVNKILQILQ